MERERAAASHRGKKDLSQNNERTAIARYETIEGITGDLARGKPAR
jgi:hypothetical protein